MLTKKQHHAIGELEFRLEATAGDDKVCKYSVFNLSRQDEKLVFGPQRYEMLTWRTDEWAAEIGIAVARLRAEQALKRGIVGGPEKYASIKGVDFVWLLIS